ncbi:2-oxoadipate dioxygenase/decarboxylase HglS [Epibacterium ulvae]|uniref:2-oxoadipate dioxygenase/decarboxylase HglS n=1 Tax=Epibacterium ulvae TaxID=1156985 RepID=UPI00248FF791|nr:VOC family protein [Epibacterium ulvae]
MTQFLHPDDIRTLFSSAMSDMYRTEVPQYGTLVQLVQDINAETLKACPELAESMKTTGEIGRLDVERHGAIRVGTAEELSGIRRMFAVMGMYPVGYYDLSVAGIPVHSTAFRPVDAASLSKNPFRVFTSLLRLDLLEDQELAEQVAQILARRMIFTNRVTELIDLVDTQGGLTQEQAVEFVAEALNTFRWHQNATVCTNTYQRLHDAHRLIADVVSFQGPHINHLTPRTLDIDTVQVGMPERGILAKAVIEGPPTRENPILLRQTSFKALEEKVVFSGQEAGESGTHSARFGEIEQRGAALTKAGRALYDQALAKTRAAAPIGAAGEGAEAYQDELAKQFHVIPDDLEDMRTQGLAYFQYRAAKNCALSDYASIEALIKDGHLIASPLTYEDFLPVSAAGIFQSNLGSDEQSNYSASANQSAFEEALGASVRDPFAMYAASERESLLTALKNLGQARLISGLKGA